MTNQDIEKNQEKRNLFEKDPWPWVFRPSEKFRVTHLCYRIGAHSDACSSTEIPFRDEDDTLCI